MLDIVPVDNHMTFNINTFRNLHGRFETHHTTTLQCSNTDIPCNGNMENWLYLSQSQHFKMNHPDLEDYFSSLPLVFLANIFCFDFKR